MDQLNPPLEGNSLVETAPTAQSGWIDHGLHVHPNWGRPTKEKEEEKEPTPCTKSTPPNVEGLHLGVTLLYNEQSDIILLKLLCTQVSTTRHESLDPTCKSTRCVHLNQAICPIRLTQQSDPSMQICDERGDTILLKSIRDCKFLHGSLGGPTSDPSPDIGPLTMSKGAHLGSSHSLSQQLAKQEPASAPLTAHLDDKLAKEGQVDDVELRNIPVVDVHGFVGVGPTTDPCLTWVLNNPTTWGFPSSQDLARCEPSPSCHGLN